ncbi:neutral ceramidase 1 [Quercus suber]|uniref:Neutral ceramidase 1 n=1 Tax=Quercus suber TaxID=58331 RepID=A0AAW0KNL4_QUESU
MAMAKEQPKSNQMLQVCHQASNLEPTSKALGHQSCNLEAASKAQDRFGDLYTEEKVAISGIHTHAGPGGYLHYLVYSITSLGVHNTLKLCLLCQPFDMPPMTVGNQI